MVYIKLISEILLPLILIVFLLAAVKGRVNAYEEFLDGIKESTSIIYKIFPAVAGLMVAIGMFRESGLMDFIIKFLKPVADLIGMPKEVLPIALLRPLSGSGGIAILSDILKNYGADNLIGVTASVIAGSTETTFYTIAIYYGSIGIKNTRHTIKAALIADFVAIVAGVIVARIFLL